MSAEPLVEDRIGERVQQDKDGVVGREVGLSAGPVKEEALSSRQSNTSWGSGNRCTMGRSTLPAGFLLMGLMTLHWENTELELMELMSKELLAPSSSSVQMSHSLPPMAKFQMDFRSVSISSNPPTHSVVPSSSHPHFLHHSISRKLQQMKSVPGDKTWALVGEVDASEAALTRPQSSIVLPTEIL
ncbi:hypothetical protein EYF80_028588 [Liparis tanakae]|uniref:Uncharacterized protein n=1 Tax=Liparis tanakae TaxID=230148 RepID=A0A4Z2H852_9TELE|nr:hypothetical protein EYF80_028588 [Liparis tanakae]